VRGRGREVEDGQVVQKGSLVCFVLQMGGGGIVFDRVVLLLLFFVIYSQV